MSGTKVILSNSQLRKKSKMQSFQLAVRMDWQKYLMLLLPVTFVFIFSYIPMYGVTLAFKQFNIMQGIFGSPWVGFDNFVYAFTLPRFGRVIRNTLVINLLSLLLGFPAPVLFAVLLNEMSNSKIVKSVQTISYLPHFLSAVMIAGLVTQICAPKTGMLNMVIKQVVGSEAPFLTQPVWWLFVYVLSAIWEGIGWNAIIYIAAIAGINPELYEAAKVDGAKRLKRIWHITLPGIKPTIILMLILNMGSIISIGFERPYVFSNSMVTDISEVISVFVYNVGLGQGDFTLGTTVGLFQSVIGAIMVLTVNAIAKGMGEEGI